MFCVKCGLEMPDGSKVCPSCGLLQNGAKFCQHCGEAIDKDCVVCPKCGKQVGEIKSSQAQQPNIIINNSNNNSNVNTNINRIGGRYGKPKNKWVAFFLCLFLGYFGVHKFYEGRIGLGFLYLFTLGIFGIGWLIDIVLILLKPNPYYV